MRLLVSAALLVPSMVGWSGTVARKVSSDALNWSTVHPFMFLIGSGIRLNNLLPLTPIEASLALLMADGEAVNILECSLLSVHPFKIESQSFLVEAES